MSLFSLHQTLKSYGRHIMQTACCFKPLIIAGAMIITGEANAQYCTPTSFSTYGSCTGGSILSVKLDAQINRSAPCIISTVPSDYYENLTSTVPPAMLAIGSSYQITVNHSDGWAGGAAVWIDFNRNQVFDASERVLSSTAQAIGGILSGNVVVPGTAVPGATRMRVMAIEGSIPTNPCDPSGWAEVEDYAIVIGNKPHNNAAVTGYAAYPAFCSGPSVSKDVLVRVANTGANQINFLTMQWEVNGVLQTPFTFGSLLDTVGGASRSDTLINIGSVPFPTGAFKTVKVWSTYPNGVMDTVNLDDTLRFVIKPMLAGTYTIGNTGADFSNLSAAISSLQSGICGPVVLNYTGTNQSFNEQVTITAIPGASATNTVTINGNGNALEYSGATTTPHLIRLQGAKYITINNLTLRSLSTTNGWGVHFYQNADSNTINGCTIDLTSVTSTSADNSGGIVFSGSTSTINNAGANGKGNTISNNTIKGAATGGLYYGIVLVPATSSATPTYNKIINNTIEDFYAYGIYLQNTNGSLVKGNTIRNVTKTANNTEVYGIALITSSRLDIITENKISNPFGAVTAGTGTFYGIHSTSTAANTPLGNDNIITNNLIFRVRSEGTQYGISCQPAPNTLIYHNTISFDHPSTTATSITRGFYHTTGQGIQFKNNLVNITRGGTGAKHLLYFNTDTIIACNNNGLYISTAATHHVGYSTATNRTSFASWNTATNQDLASVFDDPLFAYAPTGNFEPQSSLINNIGVNLVATVANDINQNLRGASPDPGAYEYTPSGCLTPSGLAVSAISSAGGTVSWVAPTPAPNTGYEYVVSSSNALPVAPGTSVGVNSDVVAGLNPSTTYYLFVRSVCNGSPGTWAGPVSFTTLCAPLAGGTYTLGGTSPDFATFTDLTNRLNCASGISGPVTINVAPNSGPYNEQITFTNITGASATNQVIIHGNGNTIQFNTTTNRSVIRLQGARYVTLDSLVVKTLNATTGWGIHVYQSALSNVIKRCVIDISSVTSSGASNSGGIVFTNSTTNMVASGANGSLNIIDNNLIIGNPAGNGLYYGIVMIPAAAASGFTANVITNNTIRNFYAAGIYGAFTNGTLIKNNLLENTTKTSFETNLYGISMNNAYRNDSITGNTIRNLTGSGPSYSGTAYGISLSNGTGTNSLTPAGSEMYITNNLIHTIKSSSNQYGIYSSNATNARYYHNTVVLDDASATGAFSRGFYHTGTATGNGIDFRNNLVSVTRGGSGNKDAVYIATSSTAYHFSNNAYWVSGASAEMGSFAGTAYATLSAWQTGLGIDQQSRLANPLFVSPVAGNFTPAEGFLSNMGTNLLTIVPLDQKGIARDTTPDPGAYEFTPALVTDAGVYEILVPAALPIGPVTPEVRIFNAGSVPLTGVEINWSVNGAVQVPTYYSGSLNTGAISTAIPLSAYSFVSGTAYTIRAWTTNPNVTTDGKTANDTATLANLYTALPGGNYTINSNAPISTTNYTSFAPFLQTVKSYGITGAVRVKVIDTLIQSAIVIDAKIPGASPVNTITFLGNDTATTVITSAAAATIKLSAVNYIIFRDMTLRSTAGTVVWITGAANANAIVNCRIQTPVLTTSQSQFSGITVTASPSSPSSYGNNGNSILIDSCKIKGGYYGVLFAGAEGAHATDNTIRNCTIDSTYSDGVRAVYQSRFIFKKNTLRSVGNGINTFTHGIYITDGSQGHQIIQNTFTGQLGGCAVRSISNTAVDARNVIANNMMQVGTGANTSLAMQVVFSENNDIVYNSVSIGSTDLNSSCLGFSGSGTTNNVLNNIFKNPSQGSVFSITAPGLTLDNNCYYNNNASNFPFVLGGTSIASFAQLKMAGANDAASIETDPVFVSATNLRTFNPLLNAKGRAFPLISHDIDDSLRNATTPDIGVNEFGLPPREDAGVVAIVSPTLPVTPGASVVIGVVIKNLGVGNLTSTNVTYESNFVQQSVYYTGMLAEGATDTVRFTSAPFSVPLNGAFSIKAWTSNPNGFNDTDVSNDSLTATYCQPMSGTYTIDAAGSGATNFVSFNEAVAALKCGGVSGAVVFEVASGTYNEQVLIPGIAGSGPASPITFRSATGVRSNVLLTYTSSNDTNNYVVQFAGTKYIRFSGMSLSNQGAAYSRVISYKVSNGVANEYIVVRDCNITGTVSSTNSANTTLVYGGGDDNRNIAVNNNTITNGSTGINISGLSARNQYSLNLTIDSNVFVNNAYNAITVSYRNGVNINRNTISSTSANQAYGISSGSLIGTVNITQNKIDIDRGYGIQCYNNAYYNEPGTAYITSNAIHISGTGSLTQQGIRVMGGSKVEVYNNTVKLESSNSTTSAAALHIEGDITYANLQNTTSYGFKIINNILSVENGYPIDIAELWTIPGSQVSKNAIAEINNNIYFNRSGANVARIITLDYVKTSFALYQGAVRINSDSISRYLSIPFTPGSLRPLESDTLAWWINGRALHLTQVANEVNWGTRPTTRPEGVPDLGAYEITPTVLPPLAVAYPATPANNTTQSFIFMGDTVAKIYWDPFVAPPASIEVRQFVGEKLAFLQPTDKFMYHYVTLQMPTGIYYYNAEIKYNDAWTGTMQVEQDIRMIARDNAGFWVLANPSSVDVTNNILKGEGLTATSSILTGTDATNPLPVKLASFTAAKDGGNVLTQWKTASEQNASHYIVERSLDAITFTEAGRVNALNRAASYRFTDELAGVKRPRYIYYRLVAVDRNGKESVSKTIRVEMDVVAAGDAILAPNPVNNRINITFAETPAQPVQVTVFTIQGEKVIEQTFEASKQIGTDAGSLKPGIYFVRINSGGLVQTIRFVKD